ncbi:MAG: hypothetical protein BGO14_05620 [Chlamydiales bacterium 38-26]|nr:hypothetical protein [Chlamydiales bacterium]OJV08378.1 MAG: hypothetical protein BGO14_05620 [Chlamydiales bacterium 38-26]
MSPLRLRRTPAELHPSHTFASRIAQDHLALKVLAVTPLLGRVVTKVVLFYLNRQLSSIKQNKTSLTQEKRLLELHRQYKRIDLYHDSTVLTSLAVSIIAAVIVSIAISHILLIGTVCLLAGVVTGVMMSKKIQHLKNINQWINHLNLRFLGRNSQKSANER